MCAFVIVQVGGLSIEGSQSVWLYPRRSWETDTRAGFNNNRKLSGVQSFCRASCCHRCIYSLITCPLWIHNAPQSQSLQHTTTTAWEDTHTHSWTHKSHNRPRHSHRGRTNRYMLDDTYIQIKKCTPASKEKQKRKTVKQWCIYIYIYMKAHWQTNYFNVCIRHIHTYHTPLAHQRVKQ